MLRMPCETRATTRTHAPMEPALVVVMVINPTTVGQAPPANALDPLIS